MARSPDFPGKFPEIFTENFTAVATNLPNNWICLHLHFLSAFTTRLASSSALIVTLKHCFRD